MQMPLAYEVCDFVTRALRSPKVATDKAELEALQRAARKDHTGYFGALHAPIAPLRWQSRLRLNGNAAVSIRQPMTMPRKMVITGMFLSVRGVPNTNPAAAVPTLDDIDLKLDINLKTGLTSSQGVTTAVTPNELDGNFVVSSSWSVQVPALIELKLRNPSPTIGAQIRWIRGPGVTGSEIFQDAIFSIVFFARDYDSNISQNVGSEAEGV